MIQRRRQVVDLLTAEKNHLASAHRHVRPDIEATIDWLEQRLKDLDGDLQRRLRESPVWREQDD
ncbi:MAG: IS110 family transposase, partial [Candidatus Competibacter sp.]